MTDKIKVPRKYIGAEKLQPEPDDPTIQLTDEVIVYVPTTQGQKILDKQTEIDSRVNEVSTFMSKEFDGNTNVEAVGGYYDKKGIFVDEDVIMVKSFTTRPKYMNSKIESKVREWGEQWDQEAMALEHEGDMFVIPTK